MSVLIVRPGRPLRGTAALPGDKSISHRALLLAALADGEAVIDDLSSCGDVVRTLACLEGLGVPIERLTETHVRLRGRGMRCLGGPPVRLDCGDSGTTMRLLAGVLAGQPRSFTLDGAAGLRRRPMGRVVRALAALGADVATADGGHPPIVGRGVPLRGADVRLEQASAQVGSAVLLAALSATGTTTLRYPGPVRDHTERMLADMGAPISWTGLTVSLTGPVERLAPAAGGRLHVPADISAAAFLHAGAALVRGSRVRLERVGVNPGRLGFHSILHAMGVAPVFGHWQSAAGETTATITVDAGVLEGVEVGGDLVPRAIDELPLVAVLATRARGTTVVRDAAELRVKESDRIAAITTGLRRMGARIEARPDGFVVEGPCPLTGATVDGAGDHRVVMALAVAGLVARGATVVSDAERVADSFPGFVEALTTLGADVEVR